MRERIVCTVGWLAVYRLGLSAPTPGGGQSIFTLGVWPVLAATVGLHVLTLLVPRFAALNRTDGGRQKQAQYTRYVAVVLAWAGAAWLGEGVVETCTLAAGAVFVMWLSEQVTQRGVGHGLSLLVVTNVLAPLPRVVLEAEPVALAGWVVTGLVATAVCIVVLRARRRLAIASLKPIPVAVPLVINLVPLLIAQALSPHLNDPWISNSLFGGLTIALCALLWRQAAAASVGGALIVALFPLLLGVEGPAFVLTVGTVMRALDDAGGLVPEDTKRVTPGS